MRKAKKQEILDFIESMHQAHREIKGALKQQDNVLAQNMLAECQEFAITLGNTIEEIEGEGCITVSYIETYCEEIFHIYERLNHDCEDENKIYTQLKTLLLKIEDSVKNDIAVKREVVFFPYTASMWDSLESVYLAAKQDPETDVYCVPIPYFDLNADKSFGQMHYDGMEYPENVEVTYWQDYKVEERRPDAIFIHNPYDEYNLVTSVHPNYYAKNLKKYTDMLVYIPYFVGINNQVGEDFCILPGTIYADIVILESKEVRRTYIQEFRKTENEMKCKGRFGNLEKKFLALGSPKFDKVSAAQKENAEIPKEWDRLIRNEDGSGKKIVFYNTTIGSFLYDSDKMLDKIEDTLKVFHDMTDIVLLWRPHPLLESTLKSMRPALFERYQSIVAEYKAANWGIFDDTPDVERAITITDAYYGDMSSVIELYKATGKPIMIQNYEVLYDSKGGADDSE